MTPTPLAPPPEFAVLLRRHRQARGLSQEELAAKAGISVTSVSYLERGLTRLPHRDTVQLLAAALELGATDAETFAQAARSARAQAEHDLRATVPPMQVGGDPSPVAAARASLDHTGAAAASYRLAVPLTPLLGREQDVATITQLLGRESVRLLTLTGPAGVGKTRLAVEVAWAFRAQQGFELAFVDLVAVAQADRVLAAIGQALGVRDAGDLSLLDAIVASLGERRLLLVLDNFEHVLAAAPVCAALLGSCPRAKALATSRAPLNIRGEYEFGVPPLPVPALDAVPAPEELERFGAVALFRERVRALRPSFALDTPERRRLAATICVRLDGLPLAIELAAAQARHFALEELAARLQGAAPLDLLVGGPRDLADHQRAMRSTVAWSYALLSADEQRVFRVLGVFVGSAADDGVVAVSGMDPEVVAACLTSLVEANLVRRLVEAGAPRYDQLVIVRAFAVEQLAAMGELDATRRAFATYVVGLIERVHLTSLAVQTAVLNRLLLEHDNLRSVLDTILEAGEVVQGLRLCAKLRHFWELRGFAVEGAAWIDRLLALADPPQSLEDLETHSTAWKVVMVLNHRLSRYQRAVEAGERALELVRRQGNALALGDALNNLANPLGELGDFERAEALYRESLATYRAEGSRVREETSLLNLGELRASQGHFEEALAFHDAALAISESLGVGELEASRALILSNKGETLVLMDRPLDARHILLESQRLYEANNQPVVLALLALGRTSWRLGDFDEALVHLERSMQLSRQQDDVASTVQALCIVAGVAFDLGDLTLAWQAIEEARAEVVRVSDHRISWRVVERAAGYARRRELWSSAGCLYAAAERGRVQTRDLEDPVERDLRARDLAATRTALGEQAYEEEISAGQTLTLEAAVERVHLALASGPPSGA
jgi:predicted ATPase/transcriptional regulator with XRE-family HTH domain